MIKVIFRWIFLLCLGLACFSGCANKVRNTANLSKQLRFSLTVQGKIASNNPNVTYYIVINAPANSGGRILNVDTEGPRVNGPDINQPTDFLAGRLPFMGLLPGDIPSQWTDFYYFRGSNDGVGEVGRGRLIGADPANNIVGEPQIIERNYSQELWRIKGDNTLEIQILFPDLTSSLNAPSNFIFNLATSDNIEIGGQGHVYDSWQLNVPFSVSANDTTLSNEQDNNTQLIMRQIPTRPLPQLPSGVNPGDVNLIRYEYQIIQ